VSILIGVPVKPFTVAKRRLSSVLDAAMRRKLGQAIALRTARLAMAVGGDVRIVTGDAHVARWAEGYGLGTLAEEPDGGLDGAARQVVAAADGREWMVLHADVPLLNPADLAGVIGVGGDVIVPAHDGGTNLIKGRGSFRFAYGPASFHTHLAQRPSARVLTTPGLALDLDTPADLATAVRLPDGAWLGEILDPIGAR
jgi:2-phospho-L-lactate guanylyltransferase